MRAIVDLRLNGRDEHLVDLGGQIDFRADAEIAAALRDGYVEKASVAQSESQHNAQTVKRQAALKTQEIRAIRPRGLWQCGKSTDEYVDKEKMHDK